jgi:hypothetical protein
MRVGDIVLIKDDNAPRNLWRKARVDEVYTDEDGLVRKVKLITVADPLLNERGKRNRVATILERPIQKLVVLLKVEETENVEE